MKATSPTGPKLPTVGAGAGRTNPTPRVTNLPKLSNPKTNKWVDEDEDGEVIKHDPLPGIHFGRGTDEDDDELPESEDDVDDELLDETDPDLVEILGFDPLELEDDEVEEETDDAAFKEEEHPRNKSGEFSSIGSGSASEPIIYKHPKAAMAGFKHYLDIELQQFDGANNKLLMSTASHIHDVLNRLTDMGIPVKDLGLKRIAVDGWPTEAGVMGMHLNDRITVNGLEKHDEGTVSKGDNLIGGGTVGSTIRHEMGHVIAEHLRKTKKAGFEKFLKDAFEQNKKRPISKYSNTDPEEYFAEATSLHTHPNYKSQTQVKNSKLFDDYMASVINGFKK